MATRAAAELSVEQCREVAEWIEANRESLPPAVRAFLRFHVPYLAAGEGDPMRRAAETALRSLLRALHLTPSSEKRRTSGSPLAGLPGGGGSRAKSEQERLEARLARCHELSGWHRDLKKRHDRRSKRIAKRLVEMSKEKSETRQVDEESWALDLSDIELTAEDRAEIKAGTEQFVAHLQEGGSADPALRSVAETLMPASSVLVQEEQAQALAKVPEGLADAKVVETIHETRVRYDFAVVVKRIEIDVEKKILVGTDGERQVIAGSTREYGPPRYQVTWDTLATLTRLIGQFAMPFNRLATLLSSQEKRFTAGGLGRMLHTVAMRFVPIYLYLGNELSGSDYLAGDDTSCRVIEVSSYLEWAKANPVEAKGQAPPWSGYATPSNAKKSLQQCQEIREARIRRREDGDRAAVPTREEVPSLGMIIGARFPFESMRRNGEGPKAAMHTTVVTGRSAADDPKSLIVFYRSHLGSCGNLFESILEGRDEKQKNLVLQGDLSTTNLVTTEKLLARFNIRVIGCSAHARRPFALYEDEDPFSCRRMLHLFTGLAIHEDQLNEFGRNRKNVLAVRGTESREMWNDILQLAKSMTEKWSRATNLGAAARYIINHFEALTAYLDDPRLEESNTPRERMLRTEKLIEGSSLFRRSLEGRFVLDVVRTILQTAVAAGVPVHEYLVSVLRTSEMEIVEHPERFTPHAWAQRSASAPTAAQTQS